MCYRTARRTRETDDGLDFGTTESSFHRGSCDLGLSSDRRQLPVSAAYSGLVPLGNYLDVFRIGYFRSGILAHMSTLSKAVLSEETGPILLHSQAASSRIKARMVASK